MSEIEFKLDFPQGAGALDYINYEPYTTNLVKKYLDKESVFLDVGAGIGYYTVIGSKLAKAVFAFEPSPECFEYLERNVKDNNCQNVELYQIAVSNHNGTTILNCHNDFAGTNRIEDVENFTRPAAKNIQVKTMRLDGLELKRIDIIKVDTEGSEFLVLDGARKILGCQRPRLILEMPDFKKDAMFALLDNLGYKVEKYNDKTEMLFCEKV